MNKQIFAAATMVVVLGLSAVQAQPGWNWGEEVDKAKEKNALYTDMLKLEKYQEAVAPLEWLLTNTPDLNKSIYINGAKIYENLADKATDKAEKLAYYEKVMQMYDSRMEHFNEKGDVLNRKALDAYKFFKGEKSKYPFLMELFTETYDVNGNDMYSSNLTAYMDAVRRFKLTGGEITDEEVFNIYSNIVDIIDAQKASGGDLDRLEKVAGYVDKLLIATIDVDCDFVETKLGPKFRETRDINLAKKIFGLMLEQKCTDSPLAVEAAEAVNEQEPTYAICKFIGQKSAADGNVEKGMQFFDQAIELTTDTEKKAEVHMNKARIYSSQGNKVAARASARDAVAAHPSFTEAYKFIGDLYMSSYETCKGGESRVKDRAVFLAAYKMYQRAGDSASMKKAKEQFPGIEEIFNENYEEGQTISTGCWVSETVTIERRP